MKDRNPIRPLPGWLLYITNHFTHLVLEAQTASPRHQLAKKLGEMGQRTLVYCPLGTRRGIPIRDFLSNLWPRKYSDGNITYLFPPLVVSPTSIGTVPNLITGTIFIILFLAITRMKISAQYSTTTLVGSVGAVVKMLLKIPLVANYGDPDFARESGLARRAFRFCENLMMATGNAFAVVYVDEVVGKYVKENFRVKRVAFLPNGGYEAGFDPLRQDADEVQKVKNRLGLKDSKVILYVGQLTTVYRLDLLVSAASSIVSRIPNARFVIVGSGPTLSTVRRSVKSAQLDPYFVFTGPVPYEDLSPFISISDVCVQLLNDWCMGTKVILYMVHHKPVIATGSWFKEYGLFLRNMENAVLIPPDSGLLSDGIVELLSKPDLRRKIGESGWQTVRPFTWDEHATETLKLLRDASAGQV